LFSYHKDNENFCYFICFGLIKRIVLKTIKTFKIPSPDLELQHKIVSQLKVFQNKQYLIVKHQENKLSELKAFKSSLLDTAFKGEL
jgi:restriction endonuclease S subunit